MLRRVSGKMCIAVPGQIISVNDTQASVNIMNMHTIVNIQLIEKPEVGEYILVHAGCAIEKIDRGYFDELIDIYERFF